MSNDRQPHPVLWHAAGVQQGCRAALCKQVGVQGAGVEQQMCRGAARGGGMQCGRKAGLNTA